jgi:serine/threonine protein kinase
MLNLDRWQEVSPYLDQALGLPEQERSTWLESIRTTNPKLGTLLESVLDEYDVLQKEEFLGKDPDAVLKSAGLAGQQVGAYTLLSEIGKGGMGSVWLAERNDGRFERQVAIKFLHIGFAGHSGEERFRREGSILGSLSHPHIAELIDAGVSSTGQPYLVLEYVAGEHMDRYSDQHRLDVEARIGLFLEVLDAVAHAHSNLIVHRDIKPSNVLVGNDGHLKLLDFGIAKLLEDEVTGAATTLLTAEGGRPMTPEYAAPEQLRGGAVTTGTDVYGLGVLLHLLLTGRHPAGAGPHSHADLVKSIVEVEPVRASETLATNRSKTELIVANAAKRGTTPEKLQRQLSGDLDNIIAKALKKDPQERYMSAIALADDLRRYLRNEPISARPDTIAYRAAKFVRRNRAPVVLASLALIAALMGVIGITIQARTARIQRDFALRQVERSAALNGFHEFLLSDAAPSGRPLTVHGLLDRAQQIIARRHSANDPNRVELMVSIGRQYLDQDIADRARELLNEAYRLSRKQSDASLRAAAACALASSLARDEKLSQAEGLYKDGLRELPEVPQFALERVSCLQSGTEIALERNQVSEAVARAEAAQQVLRGSPFDSEWLEMHRAIDLAKAYSAAGRNQEALSAFDRAARLLSSFGQNDTDTAAVLFNAWALKFDQLGRPLDAERMYRRAIDISRDGKTDDAVSPMLLANYVRTLRELGRLDEAANCAERAYNKAQRVAHQVAINQLLFERARIYTAQGKSSRAAAVLDEVELRLRQSLPAGHYAFAVLATERAANALQRGDVTSALKLADLAVTIDETAIKHGADGSFYLSTLLMRRSKIELEAGRLNQASSDATRALDQLQRAAEPGTFSSAIGHAYLILGRALQF